MKAGITVAIMIDLESGHQGNHIIFHPGSRTTTLLSYGNYVSDADLTDPSITSRAHWHFIFVVEVLALISASAIFIATTASLTAETWKPTATITG